MNLREALADLDPDCDDHWTTDGLPRVEKVAEMVGYAVTRKEISRAAPDLRREAEKGTPPGGGQQAENEGMQYKTPLVPSDDFDAGVVTPADDVVAMEPGAVYSNVELIDRALKEFERQATILARRRDQTMNKLKDLGRRSALLARARARLMRGKKEETPVQAYLKRQHEARAERAERAQRFIDAGTTQKDVLEQLRIGSKIDVAMQSRKPSRGSGRPQYPTRANQ